MIDIGLDDTEDLMISSGDFIATESTAQHQRQLLLNTKGDFKQFPTIGAGIATYIADDGVQNMIRAISIEFARDGMEVKSIVASANGIIKSNAYYP